MFLSPRSKPSYRVQADKKDVAKIVQEKYMNRAGDAINFNMIVLAGEQE